MNSPYYGWMGRKVDTVQPDELIELNRSTLQSEEKKLVFSNEISMHLFLLLLDFRKMFFF